MSDSERKHEIRTELLVLEISTSKCPVCGLLERIGEKEGYKVSQQLEQNRSSTEVKRHRDEEEITVLIPLLIMTEHRLDNVIGGKIEGFRGNRVRSGQANVGSH